MSYLTPEEAAAAGVSVRAIMRMFKCSQYRAEMAKWPDRKRASRFERDREVGIGEAMARHERNVKANAEFLRRLRLAHLGAPCD